MALACLGLEVSLAPGCGGAAQAWPPPVDAQARETSVDARATTMDGVAPLDVVVDGTSEASADDGPMAIDVRPLDVSLAPIDAPRHDVAPPFPETGADGAAPTRLVFTASPTISSNDNSRAPQAAILGLQTNLPAAVTVTVTGGGETWTLALPESTSFRKPIVGVKPATSYAIEVAASTGNDTIVSEPLRWTSPALPGSFPPVTAVVSTPARMEPGMTLFNVRVGWAIDPAPGVIVDAAGIVRWYYQGDHVTDDIRRLPNGNLLFTASDCVVEEIDVLGNTVHAWRAASYPKTCDAPAGSVPVPIETFHHDVSMLPDGNLLVLSTELRTIADYPTSDTDPRAPTKSTPVVTSVVVEFTPAGEIVKYLPINDLLDPTRIGMGVFERNWALLDAYDTATEQVADWDHANSVVYDHASDSYYVSLRMQDAIIKVRRSDDTLTWILGTPSNWREPWRAKLLAPARADLVWPYHQHAAKLTAKGLILYDNGHYRASAFETPQAEWSRAVIFSIDEIAGTVGEVWSYGAPSGPDFFYSPAMGDADLQPGTGNVLFVNSMLRTGSGAYGEIIEVMPDGTRVFHLTVRGAASSVYTVYRADRVDDIRR